MEEGYPHSSGGWHSSRVPTPDVSSTDISRGPPTLSPRNENQPPSRYRRNMGSRMWQLPQSSIQEYTSWIGDKPVSSQTPSERRFLQKLQGRILIRQEKRMSPPCMETMTQYIARLEAKKKDDLSGVEVQLIEAYHRRKANKRARRRDSNPFRETAVVPPTIYWKREPTLSNKNSNKNNKHPTPAAPVPPAEAAMSTVMSTIANLQERMNRMGLSSDKLLDIPMHEDSSTSNPGFVQYRINN